MDDDALRSAIRADDGLYERYRRFHELEAFAVMTGFIGELRAYAADHNPAFAVSANVGYLGNLVAQFGELWGCVWGPHVDFVLMENDYRVGRGTPHLLLPRGTFAPWYRLGSAFNGAPTWICPSINVPKQLAEEDHRRYYELMFLEAYANGGRWGYYWWPGVDVETRRAATAPDVLKDHIRFIGAHRDLYEGTSSMNDVAILYAEGPILRRTDGHLKYVALAQVFAESSVQFDVVYAGDGRFNPEELDRAALERYRTILVPEARDLGAAPTDALTSFARAGGELVIFSEHSLDQTLAREADGETLLAFWRDYRDEDRRRVLESAGVPASARIAMLRAGRRCRAVRERRPAGVPPARLPLRRDDGRGDAGRGPPPPDPLARSRRRVHDALARRRVGAHDEGRERHAGRGRPHARPVRRARRIEPLAEPASQASVKISSIQSGMSRPGTRTKGGSISGTRDEHVGGFLDRRAGGPAFGLDHHGHQADVARGRDPGHRGSREREGDGGVDRRLLVERLVPRGEGMLAGAPVVPSEALMNIRPASCARISSSSASRSRRYSSSIDSL